MFDFFLRRQAIEHLVSNSPLGDKEFTNSGVFWWRVLRLAVGLTPKRPFIRSERCYYSDQPLNS
jgi:hypothetical protein